jgi:hypothetical protein
VEVKDQHGSHQHGNDVSQDVEKSIGHYRFHGRYFTDAGKDIPGGTFGKITQGQLLDVEIEVPLDVEMHPGIVLYNEVPVKIGTPLPQQDNTQQQQAQDIKGFKISSGDDIVYEVPCHQRHGKLQENIYEQEYTGSDGKAQIFLLVIKEELN